MAIWARNLSVQAGQPHTFIYHVAYPKESLAAARLTIRFGRMASSGCPVGGHRHVVKVIQLSYSCDHMAFNSNKLRDETRRLGVILIAAGLLGGLLEDAGPLVASGLVLGGAAALLMGCLDEESNE